MCGPLALADWHPVASSLWPALLLVGVLGLCAQLLFTWSLGHVPTGRGGMVQQLTVVASYSLAWLFLGEPIALHVVLGAVLVMGGVLWVGVSSPQ
jgi:drug/metabolite transporter (DMT)-like permease